MKFHWMLALEAEGIHNSAKLQMKPKRRQYRTGTEPFLVQPQQFEPSLPV